MPGSWAQCGLGFFFTPVSEALRETVMEFGIGIVTQSESRRTSQHIFRFLCFLLGFTVGAMCAAHGQDSADLQNNWTSSKQSTSSQPSRCSNARGS